MSEQFTPGATTVSQPYKKCNHFCLTIDLKENGSYNHAEQYRELIEAAPDMYEALKLAKKIIIETDWDICGYSDADIKIINAALSKANPK